MVKKLIILIIFLLSLEVSFAQNCGGNIRCNCGDTVVNDYILNNNLYCDGDGLIVDSKVNLDCNGNKIIGNKSGIGLKIFGDKYITVNNCNIQNFSDGISIKIIRDKNDYEQAPKNIEIFNNIFSNNYNGLFYYSSDKSNLIHNNIFKNNNNSGVYISRGMYIYVWNNSFYDTGIKYDFYPKNSYFCKDDINNLYFDSAIGPECDCVVPYDGLRFVNGNANLCSGTYYVPKGIGIKSEYLRLYNSLNLNCNNATLIGNGTGSAFIISGSSSNIISNCNFQNYEQGFKLNSVRYKVDSWNSRIQGSRGNKLYNVKLLNVSTGFDIDSNSDLNVHFSEILVKNYFIKSLSKYFFNFSNNYWSTNNISQILDKSTKKTNLQIEPILTKNESFDLMIQNVYFKNGQFFFKIRNNGNSEILNFDIKVVETINNQYLNEEIYNLDTFLENNGSIEVPLNYSNIKGNNFKIFLDPNNKIPEINELNNYYEYTLENDYKIYLNVNLNPMILDKKITDFLIAQFGENLITTKKSEADIVINIGDQNVHLFNYLISFIDESPYSVVISSNQTEINLVTKNTCGYIAGIKYLIQNFNEFLFTKNTFIINKNDVDALGIYDYLINDENKFYYNKNLDKFGVLVNKILYNNIFDLNEDYVPIKVNNNFINYKIWNFNSNKNEILKSFIDKDKYPIVMAGGLWSDITTWKKFGEKLANEGYNVYLLELTGGENTECDDCYDYNYFDLTETVFPDYIDYVLKDSNSDKIKFIGHSNGARVALDSLNNKNFDSDLIDSLILVGVPGSFEKLSYFAKIISQSGSLAIEKLKNKNISHITLSRLSHELTNTSNLGYKEYLKELVSLFTYLDGKFAVQDNKISLNLFKEYYNWISNSTDEEPGKNLNINKLSLIGGNFFGDNDMIVPEIDEKNIYNNIGANKKMLQMYNIIHMSMSENENVMLSIEQFLRGE